jgi:phosphate transport system substrate-binding protein
MPSEGRKNFLWIVFIYGKPTAKSSDRHEKCCYKLLSVQLIGIGCGDIFCALLPGAHAIIIFGATRSLNGMDVCKMHNGLMTSLVSAAIFAGVTLSASVAFAQTQLESLDGTYKISGEIVSSEGDSYTIQTNVGTLVVRKDLVNCTGPGCAVEPEPDVVAVSQVIVLQSLDGAVRLTGTLIEATDETILIDTSSGQLNIKRELVTCEGAACPAPVVRNEQIAITVPDRDAADLIKVALFGLSSINDYSLDVQSTDTTFSPPIQVIDGDGKDIANVTMQRADDAAALGGLLSGESMLFVTRNRVTAEALSRVAGRSVSDVSSLLSEQSIGHDAVTLAVHPSNRIGEISADAISAVLSGRVSDWDQIGGMAAPLTLHMLEGNGSLLDILATRGIASTGLPGSTVFHATDAQLKEAIAGDPSALGVAFKSQIGAETALDVEMSCQIHAGNSDFTVRTQDYPLAVRWYQYTLRDGKESKFLDSFNGFVSTAAGQSAIASRGLVPSQLQMAKLSDQPERVLSSILAGPTGGAAADVLRSYIGQVASAERLSTSLRFVQGRVDLDAQSISELPAIVDVLTRAEYADHDVLLFGFSDSEGPLDGNLEVSQRRAQTVFDALSRVSGGRLSEDRMRIAGVGPVAPVACNTTAAGRDNNRRVEVWLAPRS